MKKPKAAPEAVLSDEQIDRIAAAVRGTLLRRFVDLSGILAVEVADTLRFAPLAVALAEARERRGIDLKSASKQTKLPQFVISRIEDGDPGEVRPRALERMAQAYGAEAVLANWQRANPALAQRLETTGVGAVLESIEQEVARALGTRVAAEQPDDPESRAGRVVTLQFKIVLDDVEPAIWRRVHVPVSATLRELHIVIQAAMGWTDSHLYAFDVGDERYVDLEAMDDPDPEDRNARDTHLVDLRLRQGESFGYQYDFGDGWEHTIFVEDLGDAPGDRVPACVDGARACPPEDSGGPHGYAELLEILADPNHPEHRDRRDWLGKGFDPEAFDRAGANARLSAAGRGRRAR